MNIPSITLDFVNAAVTIPGWMVATVPLVLGMGFMWMSGRNERRGIRIMSPTGDLADAADKRYRSMGIWRVLAYGAALTFLAVT